MSSPKTGLHDPLSPYMLNHNGRSAYAKYKLTVCVYIIIIIKLSEWSCDVLLAYDYGLHIDIITLDRYF
jgi:hypothetical protein